MNLTVDGGAATDVRGAPMAQPAPQPIVNVHVQPTPIQVTNNVPTPMVTNHVKVDASPKGGAEFVKDKQGLRIGLKRTPGTAES